MATTKPTPIEKSEMEARRAEVAEQRVSELLEKMRKLGIDPDS